MQIVIPMSGFGERFRHAGYEMPKPLIEVEGKPIIAHVIDMFPGQRDFIFVCNQEHLDEQKYKMREILHQYCPTGRVVGIEPHKLGPIHAVMEVSELLNLKEEVIVNYCDFTCYWDWHHFKKYVVERGCAGAIPAYKGFHPHTLGTTNYAYMLEQDGWVQGIQEKKPYTTNRMEEFASSGTYYFSSAELMLESFSFVINEDLNLNGEFYVSLAYKYLFKKKYPVSVYPLQHFMQWGTPQDVTEYNMWSRVFRRLLNPDFVANDSFGSLVIPMAGLGQRFANEGYKTIKPLIPVSGRAMAVQAINDFPLASKYVFVLRADMPGYQEMCSELNSSYPGAIIETMKALSEGQACTARIGLDALKKNNSLEDWVTFGACDNGMLYDMKTLKGMASDKDVDIIVWGARGHVNAIRNPQMFGWIDAKDDDVISNISVKKPLKDPETDPIVVGAFSFRRAEDFYTVVDRLIDRDGRVNGEFYIDDCINDAVKMGLKCKLFEVDDFISWGTPNDLKTFEYWQSCFHKWGSHPYRMELDSRLNHKALVTLEGKYSKLTPKI